jgi:uncharacterized protein YcbX
MVKVYEFDVSFGEGVHNDQPVSDLRPVEFVEKAEFDLIQAKLDKAVEIVRFYSNIENFGVTTWNDDELGTCQLEDAKEHGLTEIYRENSIGEFGIKAEEFLESIAEIGKG